MGMFDYVDYECDCPKCGKQLKDFQSKSGICMLETLKPEEVRNFYTSCLNCNTWVEFEVDNPLDNRTYIKDLRKALEKLFLNCVQNLDCVSFNALDFAREVLNRPHKIKIRRMAPK